MVKALLIFLGLVSLYCGCSSTQETHPIIKEDSGNLGEFIFRTVKRYDGRQPLNASAIQLNGKWKTEEDKYGIVIESPDIKFKDVDKFLVESYGPSRPAVQSEFNKMQYVIPAKQAGLAIWYTELPHGMRIIINKPLEKWGDAKGYDPLAK